MGCNFSNNVKQETAKKEMLKFKSSENADDRLCFSFNKKTFDDFECNLNDNIIDHGGLDNPPFGYFTPLDSSLYFFSTLFEHSLTKHDDEYRKIVKKLFNINRQNYEERYSKRESFEDCLSKQDEELRKLRIKNDSTGSIFLIEEKDGRVFYKENSVFNVTSLKIPTCDISTPEGQIKHAMIIFFMRFNEIYLQGFLGKGVLSSLIYFNEQYALKALNPTLTVHGEVFVELFEVFSKLDYLLQSENEYLADMNVEDRRDFYKEQIIGGFNKNTNSMIKIFLESSLPGYLCFLNQKVKSKALYYYSDNYDLYSSYSSEHIETLIAMKKHLKKIFERLNLSDKSIEYLVMFFLEYNI